MIHADITQAVTQAGGAVYLRGDIESVDFTRWQSMARLIDAR